MLNPWYVKPKGISNCRLKEHFEKQKIKLRKKERVIVSNLNFYYILTFFFVKWGFFYYIFYNLYFNKEKSSNQILRMSYSQLLKVVHKIHFLYQKILKIIIFITLNINTWCQCICQPKMLYRYFTWSQNFIFFALWLLSVANFSFYCTFYKNFAYN